MTAEEKKEKQRSADAAFLKTVKKLNSLKDVRRFNDSSVANVAIAGSGYQFSKDEKGSKLKIPLKNVNFKRELELAFGAAEKIKADAPVTIEVDNGVEKLKVDGTTLSYFSMHKKYDGEAYATANKRGFDVLSRAVGFEEASLQAALSAHVGESKMPSILGSIDEKQSSFEQPMTAQFGNRFREVEVDQTQSSSRAKIKFVAVSASQSLHGNFTLFGGKIAVTSFEIKTTKPEVLSKDAVPGLVEDLFFQKVYPGSNTFEFREMTEPKAAQSPPISVTFGKGYSSYSVLHYIDSRESQWYYTIGWPTFEVTTTSALRTRDIGNVLKLLRKAEN